MCHSLYNTARLSSMTSSAPFERKILPRYYTLAKNVPSLPNPHMQVVRSEQLSAGSAALVQRFTKVQLTSVNHIKHLRWLATRLNYLENLYLEGILRPLK